MRRPGIGKIDAAVVPLAAAQPEELHIIDGFVRMEEHSWRIGELRGVSARRGTVPSGQWKGLMFSRAVVRGRCILI